MATTKTPYDIAVARVKAHFLATNKGASLRRINAAVEKWASNPANMVGLVKPGKTLGHAGKMAREQAATLQQKADALAAEYIKAHPGASGIEINNHVNTALGITPGVGG